MVKIKVGQEPSLEEMITSGHRAVEKTLDECSAAWLYEKFDKCNVHPYMELVVNRSFEAAHRLLGHTGKCKRLHGHSYRVRVLLRGPVREDGMVVDFGHVKDIIDRLDHRCLNDLMENPTAESTAQWLLEHLPSAVEVRVWEGLGGCSVVARV